jgi:hypothetical protein
MIKPIKCMHCSTKTKTINKTVRSKHRGSTIILRNAPMHFCAKCADSLISLEALTTFNYIKTLPLKKGINEFDFEDIYTKTGKAII